MKVIKNAGKGAVVATRTIVEVITPATETTYDLIGLTETQMAIICILVGRTTSGVDGTYELYEKVHSSLNEPRMEVVQHYDIVHNGRISVDEAMVKRLLDTVA